MTAHAVSLTTLVFIVALGMGCEDTSSSAQKGPTCIEPPAGVIAWWPGDTDSTDVISRTGPLVWGNVRRDSGRVRKGFVFDSTDGVLAVQDRNDLNITSSFTAMLWLRFRVPLDDQPDFGGSGWDDFHFIFEKGDGSYNIRNYGLYFAKTTNTLHFNGIDTSGVEYVFNVAVANANAFFDNLAWHHVAVVWDRAALSARVMIDGVTASTATGSDRQLKLNSYPLHFGGAKPYHYVFDGRLDEIMLFGRALSNGEIQTMIAADTTGFCR